MNKNHRTPEERQNAGVLAILFIVLASFIAITALSSCSSSAQAQRKIRKWDSAQTWKNNHAKGTRHSASGSINCANL